jgi:tetratricopeptide (TPR) repeat protein
MKEMFIRHPERARRILLFSLALLFAVVNVCAQSGSHSLQGKVILPNGSQPPAPVTVKLTYNGRPIYETFTDLSGRFAFGGLSSGTYQLTAQGDGELFETTTVNADLFAGSNAPQIFTQNIQLRPKAGKPIARAGVVSAFKQEVPKAAREAYDRALKLSVAGKQELAIALLREAIKQVPTYFEAHLALANELIHTNHYDEAIRELDEARTVNPNDERLYQSFGLIMMQQKKYPVAIAVLAEAARLNPTNPMHPLMTAIALIHQAAMIDPAASASAAADRKQLIEKAEAALAKAAELSGRKLPADHLTMAMLYQMKDDRERAAKELEQYLQEHPDATNTAAIRDTIRQLRSH